MASRVVCSQARSAGNRSPPLARSPTLRSSRGTRRLGTARVRTVGVQGGTRLGLRLHGPVSEVAMSTDGTLDTDGSDSKIDADGDDVQQKSKEKAREMSGHPEQRPEQNTDGDPESDPS